VLDPVARVRRSCATTPLKPLSIHKISGAARQSLGVFLCGGLKATTRGVDASSADAGNDAAAIARQTAERLGCGVA
jgi:hydroxyethylthiazole kinase-like sugar kinase family protein